MAYVAAYLTPEQAATRLTSYTVSATPTVMELTIASDMLDRKGMFIGVPYAEDQPRAFPRSETVSGDTEGVTPDRVLDWVALTAYQLQEEDEPPIRHERISSLSSTYTRGLKSRVERVKRYLLQDYRQFTGHQIV